MTVGTGTYRVERREPSTRCIHCRERITARTKDRLWQRYTEHVVEECDAADRDPMSRPTLP